MLIKIIYLKNYCKMFNMIFKFIKKLKRFNVISYVTSENAPQINSITNELHTTDQNDSVLLSVPLYFYVDFLKTYYKPFLMCFLTLTGILLAYCYVPKHEPKQFPSITGTDLAQTADQISDSTYIQTYSPLIYEQMLKELRKMQQAAAFLQIKQQASDRKTLALQQQIQKLQLNSNKNAGIFNEERAQNMIKDALLVYDADKLGLRDYALESLGASILATPLTTSKLSLQGYVLFGFFNFRTYSNPRIIIQPEVQPGKCYAFEGSYGKIRIRLSDEIYISAVTLEHAASTLLTPDEVKAAPKHFAISGLFQENSDVGYPLGQFVYSVEGPPRQTFLITSPQETMPYQFIEFEILSNNGNNDYTCVYRLRVHGRLAN